MNLAVLFWNLGSFNANLRPLSQTHLSAPHEPPAPRIISRGANFNNSLTITISERLKGQWRERSNVIPGASSPYYQEMLWGANQDFVALTAGVRGGNRVLLVDCRTWSIARFKRPDQLFSIEFSSDGKCLLLLARTYNKGHTKFSDTIDAINTTTHVPTHLRGWLVDSYSNNVLFMDPYGRARIFDTNTSTVRKAVRLTTKVAALLKTRTDPAVRSPKPSTEIDRELPSGQPAQIRGYAFSPDLQMMYEMSKWYEGPPNNEQVELSGRNEFVRDVLFDAKKHIYWTIRHADIEPVKGFRFQNHSRKIEFMTQSPIAMGRSKLKNYPSGIYTVDLQTGRVTRTALSKDLSSIYSALGNGILAQD